MTGVQTCALPICFPVTIAKDEDSSEEQPEDSKEETKTNEDAWFYFTQNLVEVAKELNLKVDDVAAMPYPKYLFWVNFLKLRQQRSTISNGQS